MTLNEFKDLLKWDRDAILLLIKGSEDGMNNSVSSSEIAEFKVKKMVQEGKLDLIDWVIKEANKIEETQKPKFREFL